MPSQTLGSQRLLQLAVNRRPELLLSVLKKAGVLQRRQSIEWKSPLASKDYAEYRDNIAMTELGLAKKLQVPLRDFWPARGAVWDALGIMSNDNPVLVEAKAHIPEAASPGTKASPRSRQLIERSLLKTRRHLAPKSKAIWTGTFYQYANRLAHQFFLCELNGIESKLVFLDFTNASDMDGPTTEQEWRGATRMIHAILGLPPSLEQFGVYHAYLDARQLTDTK